MTQPMNEYFGTGKRKFRRGFTLVELLIVIAILGILVGLLSWGVNAARVSILKSAQAAEMASISNAVEAYRTKYGDYPPDGSLWPVMEAHLRKAFPNILVTELNILNPANGLQNSYVRNDNDQTNSHLFGGRVFDSAEALVFFLGGFSSDPQRPLTGPGGPFRSVSGGYAYNTQRENAFFEFKTNRLTLSADGAASTDETLFAEGIPNDLLPVYVGNGPTIQQGGVPIVYFDSRTYQIRGPLPNDDRYYFPFYSPGLVDRSANTSRNCARPFLSTDVNTARADKALRYANDKSFQIMNAGYDRVYGCQSVRHIVDNPTLFFLFTVPGGNAVQFNTTAFGFLAPATPSAIRYFNPEFEKERYVDDNTSNFIDGPTFAQSQ